jgi:hypothetical protein
MESFARSPSPLLIFPFVLLDIVLSVIVAYMVSTTPMLVLMPIIYSESGSWPTIVIELFLSIGFFAVVYVVLRRRLGVAAAVFMCVGFPPLLALVIEGPMGLLFPLMFSLGPFMFASVTGLGIALISALTAVVALIGWGVSRIEAKGIWKVLNFDVKPMESAAIVAIVVFTLIYWPVVLI